MANTNKRLIEVKQVVKEALLEMGDDGLHKYPRALSFALSYYRQWFKEKAREYKADFYELDSLKRLALPEDFIDVVRVGTLQGTRVVEAFENRSAIQAPLKDQCGNRQSWPVSLDARAFEANPGQYPGTAFSGLYGPMVNSWGESTGGASGAGGNLPQLNFKYLPNENVLQFDTSTDASQIYMEYLAYPFNIGDRTLVHFYAQDAMKAYIWWQFAFHDKNSSVVNTNEKRKLWKNLNAKASVQVGRITPKDILTIGRMLDHQGPRI